VEVALPPPLPPPLHANPSGAVEGCTALMLTMAYVQNPCLTVKVLPSGPKSHTRRLLAPTLPLPVPDLDWDGSSAGDGSWEEVRLSLTLLGGA